MAQTNITGYVKNELRTFAEYPFNSVDSLVLSQMSYIRFDPVVPAPGAGDAVRLADMLRAESFERMFGNMVGANSTRDMLFYMCASPRFRNMLVSNYVEHSDTDAQKQFSAVTFLPEDGTAYIAYRGTDITLVGWKEDFNMAYVCPVPSQVDGVNYFNTISSIMERRPLRVGGHSKGGNIAVYTAVNCDRSFSNRLLRVYSHDGPGFDSEMIDSAAFGAVADKIDKTLPQHSIIGMLLQTQENYRVVNSSKKWIMQHDPFSWCTKNGDFDYLNTLNAGARFTDKTLNEWIDGMSYEQRAMFVDTLYRIVNATGVRTFTDIAEKWRVFVPVMFSELKRIPPQDKQAFRLLIKQVRDVALKNLKLMRADDTSDKKTTDSNLPK